MKLGRIFGLMLLFLFFEAVVAVVTVLLYSSAYVLQACLAMTGLALVTWVVFVVLTRVLGRQRATKAAAPAKAFVPAAAVKEAAAEDSFTLEFTGLLEEANRRLLTLAVKDGGSSPTVQTLPLYLVIGPEGSGKTTAMVNSGLEPRLLAGEAQKDGQVVPTGVANIWFAEGAVFVEIAGRVLMQEPEHWEKALRVLSRQAEVPRWKRAWQGETVSSSRLRGVVLACETTLFVQSRDVHRLGTVARTLNERLQTAQSVMRTDFPTYVLLTRCDGVKYFQEFFAQLSEAESRHVLGATLPLSAGKGEYADVYADREGSRLTKFLNRLYQALADKRLLLLARDEDVHKRALAYEFPREMKKVRGEMVQFLLDTFRPSGVLPSCRLRGFYFTGQRLLPRASALATESSVADYSAVKRPSEATVFFHSPGRTSTLDYSVVAVKSPKDTRVAKQAFLVNFFRDVLLPDPLGTARVVTAPVEELKYMNAAMGACGLVLLMLSVLWVLALKKNSSMLNDVRTAVMETPAGAGGRSAAELLPQLETLRPELARLEHMQRDGAPLSYRWGLYAGNRVAADVRSLYWTRFRQAVMDPVVGAMSSRFLELRPDVPGTADVYRDLKAYRTVTQRRCAPEEAFVAGTMLPVWKDAVAHGEQEEQLAQKQLQFYAAELRLADPYAGAIPENPEAVERAQVYLQDLTGPEKILQALLNQVRNEPAQRLSTYANNYSQVLTGLDQVDGAYTSAGWRAVEDSIKDHKLVSSGEPCVVGKGNGSTGWTGGAAMDAQVQKLYSDTYLQAWKQYLTGHHVVQFTGTPDAAQKLRTLADNNRSPLLALVYMTSMNTNVGAPGGLGETARAGLQRAANSAAGALGGLTNKLGIGGKTGAAAPSAQGDNVPISVNAAFSPVRAMVDPSKPHEWLNEKNQPYMKALGDLSDAMQTLPPQVHVDVPLETQELQGAKTALLAADSALHGLAANFPNTASGVDVDLQNLLREPIELARRTISGVVIVKASPTIIATGAPAGPAPAAADPGAGAKMKATIKQVNVAAVGLCSVMSALQHKYPFDATATNEVTLEELNGLLQPGTGAYSQFTNNPEVQKTYTHAGRTWAAKPEFPANYSQGFVGTLNALAETEDELYGQGSAAPHADLTLMVDGTGKIPFAVDADGHTIKFTPGKPAPPQRLIWPPVTNSPTRLELKTGGKNGTMPPAVWPGPWGLFHLVQAADDESGNVYTFRTVQFAHSLMPLTNDKGGPGTVQIRIDSAASNLFSKGYFAKLRCGDAWAMQAQSQ